MLKWFSLSGIAKEVKRIRWPKKKELLENSIKVIFFVLMFMVAFILFDLLIALVIRALGVGI